jgi:hypothetical protein
MNPVRQAKAARLCRRLAQAVAAIAPQGIGAWPEAWDIVDPASAEFLSLLTQWEASGDAEILPRLEAAYDAVLAAWTEAVERFTREAA